MPWTSGQTGPWEVDEASVLVDGEAFLGPVFPWLDGILFAPIDITYIRGSLSTVLERASYGSRITPVGSYRGVYADATEVHVLTGTGGYATVVSKPAEYRGTYAMDGTP